MTVHTTITLPEDLRQRLIQGMQLIQQMDLDAEARDRAELMQITLEGLQPSTEKTFSLDQWTVDHLQSILFDFWLNSSLPDKTKTAMRLYKEVEALLDK
jgi:hypothetical protein